MTKIKQPYTARAKEPRKTCPVCRELNRDYRYLFKDEYGNWYCLGCRKRDRLLALHEDQR